MLSSIRFINAMPPQALTSREVNLISKGDWVFDVCAMNLPYLIATMWFSLMDSIGNVTAFASISIHQFGQWIIWVNGTTANEIALRKVYAKFRLNVRA